MSSHQQGSPPASSPNPPPAVDTTAELEHLRELLGSIDAIVWEFEADTLATTYVSPQIERVLGYTLEEAAADAQLWRRIVHPADLDDVLRTCDAHKNTDQRYTLEYRVTAADGRTCWIRDITSVIRADGHSERLRCVLTDITAEHAARQALEQSRQELAEAQRIAQLGNWQWDIVADTISWSDECYRIFGLEPQSAQLTFDVFLHLLDPATAEMIEQAVSRSLEHGAPYVVEHPLTRPDGKTVVVRSFGEVLRDEGGEPICLRGTIQDVTERHEIERLKDELIALVSHELRTPLTPLMGLLSLLSNDQDVASNPRLKRMVGMATKNARRLREVVDALLEIRQMTGDADGALDLERVDLYEAVLDALGQHAALHETHLIAVTPPDEALFVRADRDRLAHAVGNLLENATKFSPPNSTVEVHIARVDDHGRVSIRDFGVGIPQDFLGRVFDRFTQADSPQRRSYGGIGLGLAIAKAIVERHDGRVGFERPDGEGTIAYLELPLID